MWRDVEPAERDRLFIKLVITHKSRLLGFVLRRVGHYDDARDIAQDSFASAALALDQFRGECELSTWLYGIALNMVRNYLSRAPHRLYRFESDDLLSELRSSGDDNPEDTMARRQLVRRLLASIEALPASMQEVLRLVGLEQLSYEEAATALGVPLGTVRSRLARARSALRAHLQIDDRDAQVTW